jgi:dihydroorotate dehydrogenase (NAD+) catalytic subunit
VAVRMVYQVAQAVSVPVIGIGGIASVEDALEFLMAGATAIQVGTAVFADPGVLLRLIDELESWMERNGVTTLAGITGCANPRFRAHIAPEDAYQDEVATG